MYLITFATNINIELTLNSIESTFLRFICIQMIICFQGLFVLRIRETDKYLLHLCDPNNERYQQKQIKVLEI